MQTIWCNLYEISRIHGQSLKASKFYYLGNTRARRCATDSVLARIKNAWNRFRNLLPLSISRGFPFGANGKLFSGLVDNSTLNEKEKWPGKADKCDQTRKK